MRCLGRTMGLGLVFIFLVLFPCSMWTFHTQRIALSEETYKNLFADEGFYRELIPVVLPSLIDGLVGEDNLEPGELSLVSTIEALDHADWEDIAPQVVPGSWVRSEVEANLDNFFRWLDGDAPDLKLVFHTREIQQRLAGPQGEQAIQQMFDRLPACQPNQLDQFVAFAERRKSEFPYCRPPQDARCAVQMNPSPAQPCDVWLKDALDRARMRVAVELEAKGNLDLLEEARLQAEDHDETFTDAELDRFRASVRLWQRLLILVFLIPASLLALVVIVSVRSSKMFFRWMGWPLIIGSLFTLVPLLLLPLLTSDIRMESRGEVEEGFAVGGDIVAEVLANGMMRLIVGEFTWPVLVNAAIVVVFGFGFVVLSVLLPDPDAPVVGATQTPPGVPVASETHTQLDDTPPAPQPPEDRPHG